MPAAPRRRQQRGPVFITDHGRPAHVLLTMEDDLLLSVTISLAEAFAQPEGADALFDPPRIGGGIFRPADLA